MLTTLETAFSTYAIGLQSGSRSCYRSEVAGLLGLQVVQEEEEGQRVGISENILTGSKVGTEA